MTAPVTQDGKQVRQRRRWRRWALLGCAVCCVLLWLLYLCRFALFGDMIKQAIADGIADALHAEVNVAHIEGSLFSDVQLNELSLQARGQHASLQAASLQALKLDYSLWGLLDGFDIDDLTALHIHGLDLNLQNTATQDKVEQIAHEPFDPAIIAPFFQGTLPDIKIDGHINIRRKHLPISTGFSLAGDDNGIQLKLSECQVDNMHQIIGDVHISRLDRHSFRIQAPHFHRSINIKNARLTVTSGFIDLRLPFVVAKQRQSLNYRYAKNEQDLECHLDFYWRETPRVLRSFLPGLLPVSGHSRIVASLNQHDAALDLSCMVQADNLTWNLNDEDQLVASVHGFIENDEERCHVEINHIDLRAPNHSFAIRENVSIRSSDHKDWQIDETKIQTSSGAVNIGGQLSQENSDFMLAWEHIDLGILSKAFDVADIKGYCNGSVYIGGKLSHPNIKVSISAPNIELAQRNFEFDLACTQDQDGIEIDHCYINYGTYAKAIAVGSWPRFISSNGWTTCAGKDAKLSVDIDAKALENIPELHGIISSGSVHGGITFRIKDDKPLLTSAIDIRDLTLALFASHEDFVLNGEHRMRLDDASWQSQLRIDQNARNYLQGTVKGTAPVPLLEISNWDNNWNAFLDTCKGQVDFKDLFFKIEGSIPRIGDINGSIIMDGRRISTKQLSATLGFEPLIIDGYVIAGHPHISEANVRVQGSRVLIVQSPGLRLRSDANLLIEQSDSKPLSLSGNLKIVDALYSEDFITTNRHSPEIDSQFQLFSLPEAFLAGANLDINVSAERSIRIRNSMLRADASGELRIRGTGAVPEPAGDVLIHEDNARLTLPFSTIWFNPSTITFKAGDPFNPAFFISGYTKMQGYDMRIQLEGSMSDFSVNGIDIVSNPPLGAEEATRLITTGVPPRNIFDTGKDIDTSGLVIGWAIVETLRKVFGSGDPDKEKFINNIEVQIGRDVSDNGYNTIEVIAPLPRNFFLKVERDKYEDYNADIGIRKEW